MIFNIFTSLTGFEQDIIRERTQAGSAKRKIGGRPKGLSEKAKKATAAETLCKVGELSVSEIY